MSSSVLQEALRSGSSTEDQDLPHQYSEFREDCCCMSIIHTSGFKGRADQRGTVIGCFHAESEQLQLLPRRLEDGVTVPLCRLLLVFRPIFASAKMVINPNADLELKTPKAELHLEVQNIAIELTRPQVSLRGRERSGPGQKVRSGPEGPVRSRRSGPVRARRSGPEGPVQRVWTGAGSMKLSSAVPDHGGAAGGH